MMENRKNTKKKPQVGKTRSREQAVLSVISVRISDEEKNRIDEIMQVGSFKSYSDVLRMAMQMFRVPGNEAQQIEPYN